MMLWIKRNALLLASSAAAMLLGLGVGIRIPKEAEAPPAATPAPASEAVLAGESPSILPTTALEVEYVFEQCGHAVIRRETGEALAGKDREAILRAWPDATVLKLTSEEARIRRARPGYCPDHFVLMLAEGGKLSISHVDAEEPTRTDVTMLAYDASTLSSKTQELLRMGIAFDGLEQINAYLEDVES